MRKVIHNNSPANPWKLIYAKHFCKFLINTENKTKTKLNIKQKYLIDDMYEQYQSHNKLSRKNNLKQKQNSLYLIL